MSNMSVPNRINRMGNESTERSNTGRPKKVKVDTRTTKEIIDELIAKADFTNCDTPIIEIGTSRSDINQYRSLYATPGRKFRVVRVEGTGVSLVVNEKAPTN